ncbi:MAG: hypothetical protein AB7L84_15370 [Acidimicrobiia bacterium]
MVEHEEACPEWQEDVAGFLVAQIDPAREVALAHHLRSCDRCRAEVDSLSDLVAVSLTAEPEPHRAVDDPPPELRSRVTSELSGQRRARRSRRRLRALVADARAWAAGGVVVAVVAVIAAVVVGSGDGDGGRLPGDPVRFALAPEGARVEAVVADDPSGSVVQVIAEGLDPAETYALWLTPPGVDWTGRVPAGTFRPDEAGRVDVRLECALPAEVVERVWATDGSGAVVIDTQEA